MLAASVGAELVSPTRGDLIRAGRESAAESWQLRCLHPPAGYVTDSANARSQIWLLEYGDFRMLLTGDAEPEGLDAAAEWLEAEGKMPLSVLKTAHHGSGLNTGRELLERLAPRQALISCGRGNRYSHPHDVVLKRLKEAGVLFWRTDISGNVTFNVTETEITPEAEKQ